MLDDNIVWSMSAPEPTLWKSAPSASGKKVRVRVSGRR
jgi:hypothetical protein